MTPARVRAAREVHGILAGGHLAGKTDAGRAAAALDALSAVTPADCVILLGWDAATGRYSTITNRAYPAFAERWFETQSHRNDRFRAVAMEGRSPLRPRDLPWEPVILDEFARPGGFRDGFNLALRAADGRYVGSLVGSTAEADRIDDLTVDLLTLLAPSLAPLVDAVPRTRLLSADLADGGAEGLVVSRSGRARALTAGAEVDLVHTSGPVWPLVRRAFGDRRAPTSMTLLAGRRVLEVSVEAGDHRALVVYRAVPAPFGLSVRELEILAGLAEGATNIALAGRFALTPRTVATYVERLLVKTGCPNRTAAARLAASLNLHAAALTIAPSDRV